MKLILKIVAVLVLLVVVGLVAGFFYINSLVKSGVERAGEYALGVKTELVSADVALFSGNCKLNGLRVKNPSGDWDSDQFFQMDNSEVAVTLGSLLSDTVEVPLISLSDISMNLERKEGSSNYKPILEHLKKFESKDEETKKEEGPGKKFIIRELRIENVMVTVDLLPVGGKLSRTAVEIKEIKLEDVGSESDKGVLLSQVTDIVFKAILDAVLDKGGQLPTDIVGELQAQLNQLEDLNKVVGNVTAKFGEAGKQAIEGATKTLKEAGQRADEIKEGADKAGKDIEKGVKDLKDGIGGILGGKKDKEKEKQE